MNCAKARRLLSRYIDKELVDESLKNLIEEHLGACPDCQAEFNSLVKMRSLIKEKEKIATGEDFLARLKDRLSKESPIIRLRWLPEAGDLARRLIPVPVVIMILMLTLVFSKINGGFSAVDEYIFGDLTNKEISIVNGYINNSDLLQEVVFK